MNFLVLLGIGLTSALFTFVMNWLALIPWRRTEGKHWSERARAYHPTRVSAASNLWVLPAVASLSVLLLSPENGPHWALVAIVASVGTLLGTMPMDREVWPRIKPSDLWQLVVRSWIMRFLMWFVFLAAAVLMPEEFNYLTAVIALIVCSLLIWWNKSGWLQIGRWLRLMAVPPERLVNITRQTAAKMNVSFTEVLLLHYHSAQAFALPGRRAVMFSQRLIEILTDDELAAVCAHELAHLTEARSDYYKRYTAYLTFMPWILIRPMLHNLGVLGFYLLLGTTVAVPRIVRRMSHKLEERADAIAHAHEPDPGTYARALAKLYEDNLLPAVNAQPRASHPHLYDRMLAAGVTPDFPRPAPCSTISWNGVALSLTLGVLAALLIFQIAGNTSAR